MKRPTFLEGVAVAFVASVLGGALYGALTGILPGSVIWHTLVAAIGLGYVLYLLARSRNPVGRITSLLLWVSAAGATWLTELPLMPFILVHVGLVWLIRSVYFYASALSALADLGLSLVSLLAGVWAATGSGSPSLGIWSFFLVQALFGAIPPRMGDGARRRQLEDGRDDRFDRAHHAARAALRRLSSIR